jgi:hypothetical protein
MEMTRISPPNDDNTPINSEEFEAGYLARLSGEPQCISGTRGWRAGWAAQTQVSMALICVEHPEKHQPN